MSLLSSLLALVAVGSAGLLILVILLQEPRGGAVGVLGGSVQEVVGAGRVPRLAATLAGVWIVSCLAYALVP